MTTDDEIRSKIRQIQGDIFALQRSINERKKESYNRSVLYSHLMIQTGAADDSLSEAIRAIDNWGI